MELNNRTQQRTIGPRKSILFALKRMDELAAKSLIVSSGDAILTGVLSIGDIQRAIIGGVSLNESVKKILRPNPRILLPGQSADEAKDMMLKHRMEFLPVVNTETNQIEKVYFWADFFHDKVIGPARQFDMPVVIMAGGMGTRLKPLTNVLPKPLIPLGDKTIIEHIFDRFTWHGCSRFFVSVNYKAELIEYYLKEQNLNCEIEYLKELQPLGTAGSLSLLKDKISQPFFVTNCDILIEEDYSQILDYHIKNKNELTIVAALKHFPIPYGTIKSGENGMLISLDEKPELTFKINSGMYILEPHIINEIPKDQFFHITHLIELIKNRGGKVGVFPVSEKSWKDIGNWTEYLKEMI